MKKASAWIGLLPLGLAAQPQGVDAHKLAVKTFVDFGHLVSGRNPYGPGSSLDSNISMLPLNRVNVAAVQDVSVGRFDVSVGLSALVWWPYGNGSADLSEKVMNVKPMVPVARGRWQFGEPGSTSGALQVGTFNYKYNPDAKDLGEYLYRSGTYPGYLWSNDGWLLMNRAGNYSHGLLLSVTHLGGMLKHNVSLFMETVYYPIGDFSPGYDFSFTSPWVEFGGGAVLNHYLPIKPSLLTPKLPENTYAQVRDARDTATPADDTVYIGRLDELQGLLVNPLDTTVLERWTFKGVKLMGRAALNLGRLLPEEMRGPEDLRLFVEAALLGVENQRLYYEKTSERIPVMFGVTLPTFRVLDLLSLQGEYYRSPYNDIDDYNAQSLPIWKTQYTDSVHSDDFKWAIHAKKVVNKVMTVYAQAASDHFRLTDGKYKVSSIPLTSRANEWYYLLRLEFTLR